MLLKKKNVVDDLKKDQYLMPINFYKLDLNNISLLFFSHYRGVIVGAAHDDQVSYRQHQEFVPAQGGYGHDEECSDLQVRGEGGGEGLILRLETVNS